MYVFLYLDVLHVHTGIVRRINICMSSFIWMYCMFIQQSQGEQTYVWLLLFGCIACSYSNPKENKHMYAFLYLDVLHVHTAIVRRINIGMASFIWMYCIFTQQL